LFSKNWHFLHKTQVLQTPEKMTPMLDEEDIEGIEEVKLEK
jgi:hypothetical protein